MAVLCSQKMPGKPDLWGWGWEAESKGKTEEGESGGVVRRIQEGKKENAR